MGVLTRKPLPPTEEAVEARASFSRATSILSEKQTSHPPRKYPSEADNVRKVAEGLAAALEQGDQLPVIDELAQKLAALCLHIQRLTLRARSSR